MTIPVQGLSEKLQGYPAESEIAINGVENIQQLFVAEQNTADNLSGDRWEDTEEGMHYYGREYDPVTDEVI